MYRQLYHKVRMENIFIESKSGSTGKTSEKHIHKYKISTAGYMKMHELNILIILHNRC
jgi:hypothetical protein